MDDLLLQGLLQDLDDGFDSEEELEYKILERGLRKLSTVELFILKEQLMKLFNTDVPVRAPKKRKGREWKT